MIWILFADTIEVAQKASVDAGHASDISIAAAVTGVGGLILSIATMWNNRKRDKDKSDADLEASRMKLEFDSGFKELKLKAQACEEHREILNKQQLALEKKSEVDVAEAKKRADEAAQQAIEANKRAEEVFRIIIKRQRDIEVWQKDHSDDSMVKPNLPPSDNTPKKSSSP